MLSMNAQTWIEKDKTLPVPHPLPTENYYYGYSTAVDGDYAVIGAYNANNTTGVAYVLYYNGTNWEHVAKLTASDGAEQDYFGYSVSISGDNIVVGAWQHKSLPWASGAAYVYTKPAGGWADATETVTLVSDDLDALDNFGRCVSIEGNTIVVGATGDDDNGSASGSAYVFTYDGSSWNQVKKLTASDGADSDVFGESLSISGNNIVVSAYRDDDIANQSGSAYVFTNPGTGWANATQTAKLTASDPEANDYFGYSVDISGDNIIIGAYNKYFQQGAAYRFEKPASGWTNATETEKILEPNANMSKRFGSSVSISGDYMIIGAKNSISNGIVGALYVYQNTSGTWSQTAKLTPSAVEDYAEFAISASISGDNIVVGAYKDGPAGQSAGSVFHYTKPTTGWTNMKETEISLPYGDYSNENDGYGNSIAIDGNYAVVGASYENKERGGAYVLYYNGTEWITQAKLTASDGATNDEFGCSVAIDGDNIVIGAYEDGNYIGAAYVFTKPAGGWADATEDFKLSQNLTSSRFGISVDILGDNIFIGAEGYQTNKGCVYVYSYSSGTWTLSSTLTASDGAANDYFGCKLDVYEENLVVGAYGESNNKGAAYVFTNNSGTWTESAKLTASDGATDDKLSNVAIDGDNIVIGASYDDTRTGSAYFYEKPATGWTDATETLKITASDGATYDYFGSSIDIEGSNMVIGAFYNNDGANSGAAYLYTYNGATWVETEKYSDAAGIWMDYFGWGVCISGDNIAIGAKGDDDVEENSGSVYFYKYRVKEQPVSQTDVCPTSTVNFTVETNFTESFQWQVSADNGTSWSDIINNATYINSQTDILTVNVNPGLDDYQYRCLLNNVTYGDIYTDTALLTVIADNENPVLAVQNITIYVDESGNASVSASDVVTSATDNCFIADTILSQSAFDCSDIGIPVSIDVTLSDVSGNEVTDQAIITVEDNIAPVLSVEDYTLELDASGNATLTTANVVIATSDNCAVNQTTLGKTSFDCSNIGTPVNVDVTLSDESGNETTEQATITVVDNINPSLTVQDYTLELDATGNGILLASDVVTAASDNCTLADTTLSKTAFNSSNIGTPVTVDVTLSDESGNDVTKQVTITVVDNVAPVLSVQDYTIQLNELGEATLTLLNVVINASDNCSLSDTTLSKTDFYCSDIGTPVTVNITLSDGSGNETTEPVTITVEDNVDPVLSVQDYTLELDASGNATLLTSHVVIAASDNCSVDQTTLSKTAFDCSNIGTPVTVDVTLSDASGNETTEQSTITVVDNVDPSLTVHDYTLELDASGNAVLKASDVVTAASDNCSLADTTLNITAFDCSNVGTPVTVDVTLSDESGNEVTKQVTITVEDNANPILSVQNYTLQLDETGNATLASSDVVTTAIDNCSLDDTMLSKTSFDCSNIGTPVTVNVTLSDGSGNETTEQVTITVEDTINPDFDVNDYTLELNENGEANLVGAMVASNALDNCSNSHYAISKDKFDCSNIGTPVTIDVTLHDANGNTTTKQAIITVEDNVDPLLTVQDYTLELDAAGNAVLKVSDVVTTASDNCTLVDTTLSKTSFDCSNIGTPVTVDVTLTDESGNSVTNQATITVVDSVDPILNVQDYTVQLDELGEAILKLTDVVVSASDNCSLADTTLSQTAFNCSNVGTPVTVNVTLTDESGNETTEQVTITVVDNVAPVISSIHNNQTISDEGNCEATLPDYKGTVVATDNCDASLTVTQLPAAGTTISGLVPVTLTVTDDSGNETSVTFNVLVNDNTDPELSVKDITLQLDINGEAILNASDVVTSATDNCTIADTTLNQITFDCSNIGTPISVEVTLSDVSGNSVTKQLTVTVEDNVDPVLAVQNATIYVDEYGSATLSVKDVVTAASDNCTIVDTTLSQTSFSCTNTGTPVTVDVTLTDISGNSTIEQVTITVIDNIKPVLSVQDHTLQLSAEGNATLNLSDVVIGASDNCEIADTTLSQTNFSCTNTGTPVTVDVTLTDISGNSTTEQVTITVEDKTDPAIPTLEDIKEECSATVTAPTTTDGCAGTITATTNDPLTYDTQGEYTITWYFDDGNGNKIDVDQKVIIKDITLPTIECRTDTTINLTEESVYTVPDTRFDPLSTSDNCTIASISNDLNNTSSLKDVEIPTGTTSITWTITDEAGNKNTCSYTVTVNVSSGTDELISLNEIKIYPNPASDFVIVESEKLKIYQIEIFDITGKLVKNCTINENLQSFDISNLEQGIYFVNVKTNNVNRVFKLIKK